MLKWKNMEDDIKQLYRSNIHIIFKKIESNLSKYFRSKV